MIYNLTFTSSVKCQCNCFVIQVTWILQNANNLLEQLMSHNNHDCSYLDSMSQTLKMTEKKDRTHCICVQMSTLLLIFIHYGNVIGAQQ